MKDFFPDSFTSDSIPIIKKEFNIDTQKVGNVFRIDSVYKDIILSINDLEINNLYSDSIAFSLGRLFPELSQYNDSIVNVPALQFADSSLLTLSEKFNELTIDSGYLTIKIFNGLPLDIDSLSVLFSLPTPLIMMFDDILSNEAAETTINFSGKSITNTINCKLSGATKSKDSVVIDTSVSIKIIAKLFVNRIKSIIGKIPNCSTNVSINLLLQPFSIDSALIDSGIIYFYINNPLHANFNAILSNHNCSFLPFSSVIFYGENDTSINLHNGVVSNCEDTMKLFLNFSTSGGEVIDTVDQFDTIFVKVRLYNIILSYFSGYIDTIITIDLPEISEKIDYKNYNLDKIQFDSVWLFIDIYNETNTSPYAKIYIQGIKGITTRICSLEFNLNPCCETYKVFKSQSITDFVNFFPESINIYGKVELTGQIEVKNIDKLYGSAGFMFPIIVNIKDTLEFTPDTIFCVNIPKEINEAKINKVELLTHIVNDTQIEGDVEIFMGNQPQKISSIGKIEIKNGSYDKWYTLQIIDLLKSDKLYSKIIVRIYPSYVKIFAKDRIIIKSLLRINTQVGG